MFVAELPVGLSFWSYFAHAGAEARPATCWRGLRRGGQRASTAQGIEGLCVEVFPGIGGTHFQAHAARAEPHEGTDFEQFQADGIDLGLSPLGSGTDGLEPGRYHPPELVENGWPSCGSARARALVHLSVKASREPSMPCAVEPACSRLSPLQHVARPRFRPRQHKPKTTVFSNKHRLAKILTQNTQIPSNHINHEKLTTRENPRGCADLESARSEPAGLITTCTRYRRGSDDNASDSKILGPVARSVMSFLGATHWKKKDSKQSNFASRGPRL